MPFNTHGRPFYPFVEGKLLRFAFHQFRCSGFSESVPSASNWSFFAFSGMGKHTLLIGRDVAGKCRRRYCQR